MKWWINVWFKFKFLYWVFMLKDYQFEKTSLPPLSAENTVKVLTRRYRPKDENNPSSELEEIIQVTFPNGEIEEIPVTDNNLKYASALSSDIENKPRLKNK